MAFGHVGGLPKGIFWEEGEGDKVALEFDLYQANVTKAAAVSALNDKALIKVYAFKVETKTESEIGAKTETGDGPVLPSAEVLMCGCGWQGHRPIGQGPIFVSGCI